MTDPSDEQLAEWERRWEAIDGAWDDDPGDPPSVFPQLIAEVRRLRAENERLREDAVMRHEIGGYLGLADAGGEIEAIAKLRAENEALQAAAHHGVYMICGTHKYIMSPDKRMPCPACGSDKLRAENERLEAEG